LNNMKNIMRNTVAKHSKALTVMGGTSLRVVWRGRHPPPGMAETYGYPLEILPNTQIFQKL